MTTVSPGTPDYSRPSIDIERRAHSEWRWGVTQTVRPEMFGPLLANVEYNITVKLQAVSGMADNVVTVELHLQP